MTSYFDATLEAPPITEQNNDPILPEERHVFELVGFERSQPDQWRKEGGIRWTFLVYHEDGRTPFVFQDEQYTFWRTTGIDKTGRPLFTLGTYANDWASALLGRPLGVDAHFQISELRGQRFSAMVVWEKQRTDPNKKTIKLASLRHLPVSAPAARNGTSATQVPADPSDDDIDRASILTEIKSGIRTAKKLGVTDFGKFQDAFDHAEDASLADLRTVLASLRATIEKALDD